MPAEQLQAGDRVMTRRGAYTVRLVSVLPNGYVRVDSTGGLVRQYAIGQLVTLQG